MTPTRKFIGSFKTSGELVVSDPCYVTKHTEWSLGDLMGTEGEEVALAHAFRAKRLANWKVFEPHNEGGEELCVVPGTWNVRLDQAPPNSLPDNPVLLNHRLVASLDGLNVDEDRVWEQEFHVMVDAGLMGIYDVDTAQLNWDYSALTETDAVWPFGPVVASGEGDGDYPVHVTRNENGEIVGVMVTFSSPADIDWA